MRTRIALFLTILLFLLSIVGFVAAALAVSAPREMIGITEEVLVGNVAAAEGLELQLQTTVDANLHWNTLYRPGKSPTTESTYDFSALDRYPTAEYINRGVSFDTTFSAGFSFGNPVGTESEERGLIAAYNALYRETPNGEERRKKIRLEDYYTYYPITGEIDLPDYHYRIEWEDAHQVTRPPKTSMLYIAWRLQEYFRIPILAGQTMEISVSKSRDGHSIGIGSSSGTISEGEEFYSGGVHSTLGADACYFVISARTSSGNIVDLNCLEEGYGIYCLPFMKKPEDIDRLSMVYPLDPRAEIEGLNVSADKKKLLLWEKVDGTAVLRVLDLETMKEEQVLRLGALSAENNWWSQRTEGDLHLMVLGYRQLILVERDAVTGEYAVRLCFDLDPEKYEPKIVNVLQYAFSSQKMAWDGERLVVADFWLRSGGNTERKRLCDFYYAVLSEEGLLYFATCAMSHNTATDGNHYHHHARPIDSSSITVTWSEG